jgi:hypothetical protein
MNPIQESFTKKRASLANMMAAMRFGLGMNIGGIAFFSSDDIYDLNNGELEQVVRTSPIAKEGSSMTLNKSDSGYIFCYFNF